MHHTASRGTACTPLDLGELSRILHSMEIERDVYDLFNTRTTATASAHQSRDNFPPGLCLHNATLTLSRNGSARREDRFVARPGGTLAALTEGQDAVVQGQVIGLVERNSGGLCQLRFNSRCTIGLMDGLLGQLECRSPASAITAHWAIGWAFCCFYLGRHEAPEEHVFVGCTQQATHQPGPVLRTDRWGSARPGAPIQCMTT